MGTNIKKRILMTEQSKRNRGHPRKRWIFRISELCQGIN